MATDVAEKLAAAIFSIVQKE